MPLILKRNARKNHFITYSKKATPNAKSRRSDKNFSGFKHEFINFFRRAHLKNFGAILVVSLGIGLIAALAFSLSFWLYEKAVTSDFFATRHIDIIGASRLSREMVLEYGGIKEGDNSLSASIGAIEQKLQATPWVEEVSVKRLLPDRFVIKIKERMPSFWVQKDGVLHYANERGEIIAPVETSNFLSLPTLTIEQGGEEASAYLSRLLKDINARTLPIEAGSIASVTASPARGIELYLEDRDMRISIGVEEWEENLTKMGLALGDLAKRHELGNVRELRVVDGNVWAIRNK